MKRALPVLGLVFTLGLASTLALGACADSAEAVDQVPSATSGEAMLRGTQAEREALDAFDQRKRIRARELAEKLVKADPGSFLGTWVLSQVMHVEEGHHARARFLLEKAKSMLRHMFGEHPTDEQAQLWHKKLLIAQIELLGEMEKRPEQLAMLDEFDANYRPKMTRARIWPLMKDGRHEEARAAGKELLHATEFEDRVSAYNGLMAVEDEVLNRRGSYQWGREGIDATQGRVCILLHNTAQSAMTLFKFDEVENYARSAVRAEYDNCPSSSYEHLANLYLHEGQFQKAISAFKKLARHHIEPRYRPHFDKNNKGLLAEILLGLGKIPEALRLAELVFAAPDRTGMTSVSVEDIRFGHALLYWMLLDQRIEEMRDQGSIRGVDGKVGKEWLVKKLELKQWELARVMLRLGMTDDILVTNLRPFLRGVKPWYAGMLGKALGPGLVGAALDRAEELDAPQIAKEAAGYYEAVRGELAYWADDFDAAVAHGENALAKLQPQNGLLIARVHAYIAGAMLALGRDSNAMLAHLNGVLHSFPTALRYFDIRLPVAVTYDGGPLAAAVAEKLTSARRFVATTDAPFQLRVSGDTKAVRICLLGKDGFRYDCTDKTFEIEIPEMAEKAIDGFEAQLFSPKVELTSSDINSLDGSPVRQSADKALKELLDAELPKAEGDEDE